MRRSAALLLALSFCGLPPALGQDGSGPADPESLPAPAPSSGVAVEAKRPASATLTWPPSTGPVEVWRRVGAEGKWTRRAVLGADRSRFVDRLEPGSTAWYRVDPVGGPRGSVLGPVKALRPFYVELLEVTQGRARLRVHKWNEEFQEWQRSAPLRVGPGDPLGRADEFTDFRTGATVLGAGPSALDPSVHYLRYRTQEGQERRVTTRDALPSVVYRPPPKRERKPPPRVARPNTRVRPQRAEDPPQQETLEFPPPTKVGTIPGRRVIWEIENRSDMPMTIALTGQSARHLFKVGPQKTYVVRLRRGDDFKILATAKDNRILPLVGAFGLASGSRYRTVLAIRVLDPEEARKRKASGGKPADPPVEPPPDPPR
ncbi:MAG: hypothetical protein D6731_09145 [Planctomycetota bacterium]|nr:MAG: hypothetical protein D6731_09145 [Planctomycetota bacterium]